MTDTAHLDIVHPSEGAAGQAEIMADGLNWLDAIVMPAVLDRDLTAAPALTSPTDDGKRYIVGATHASWTGTRNGVPATAFGQFDYVVFVGGGFVAWTPEDGWVTAVIDEKILLVWETSLWIHLLPYGVTTALTASTTQTQGAATQLAFGFNQITVCANANDALRLPFAAKNVTVEVVNRGAQTAQIFPASADKINGAAADASTTLASGKVARFRCIDTTDWYMLTGA